MLGFSYRISTRTNGLKLLLLCHKFCVANGPMPGCSVARRHIMSAASQVIASPLLCYLREGVADGSFQTALACDTARVCRCLLCAVLRRVEPVLCLVSPVLMLSTTSHHFLATKLSSSRSLPAKNFFQALQLLLLFADSQADTARRSTASTLTGFFNSTETERCLVCGCRTTLG